MWTVLCGCRETHDEDSDIIVIPTVCFNKCLEVKGHDGPCCYVCDAFGHAAGRAEQETASRSTTSRFAEWVARRKAADQTPRLDRPRQLAQDTDALTPHGIILCPRPRPFPGTCPRPTSG